MQNIFMEMGSRDSLTGEGLLNFTNAFRKENSILEAPLDILKDLGLDPGAFTPVSGEVACQFKEGKLYLTEIKNTFSEGKRSQFSLATQRADSFIDLQGNLSIYLEMKQHVLLKIAEPFILAISGSLEKPRYEIIKK